MFKTNKTTEDIITEEMMEFAMLVMKYSRSQLAVMVAAVDIDNLQNEMAAHGATREELRASSECHHDIHAMKHLFGIDD